MIKTQNPKKYDLEDRTLKFARDVKDFIKTLPRSNSNTEYAKQLIRSSSSIGANYIEANESLSKKDFVMRIKISRKEAKETQYWMELIEAEDKEELMNEVIELRKIFSAILVNSKI